MRENMAEPRGRGFTLVELLTVMGLVALLASLLLPVAGRMRTAAAAATCLANLRQIGVAWSMRMSEDGGRLIEYVGYTPDSPDLAWNGYWPGIADKAGVRATGLLCPAAHEPAGSLRRGGYGGATAAWTGEFEPYGSAVRYNAATFRVGSYGFNRYLTARGGSGRGGEATFLSALAEPSNVPAFLDCAYFDVRPLNGKPADPVESPPDLRGAALAPDAPQHWNFLLARHGRGVNVYLADGGARWIRLEELYLLSWRDAWQPYRLSLPRE